jgi:hypothetical protein
MEWHHLYLDKSPNAPCLPVPAWVNRAPGGGICYEIERGPVPSFQQLCDWAEGQIQVEGTIYFPSAISAFVMAYSKVNGSLWQV